MNLDERENYRQDDPYFQDDETRSENERPYDDIDSDAPSADHSISDTAEPDYGNDFAEEEINRQSLNPRGDEFAQEFDREDNDGLDDDGLDDDDLEDDDLEDDDLEDDDLEDDDLEDDDLEDDDLEDDDDAELDEEDQTGTNPNRNL